MRGAICLFVCLFFIVYLFIEFYLLRFDCINSLIHFQIYFVSCLFALWQFWFWFAQWFIASHVIVHIFCPPSIPHLQTWNNSRAGPSSTSAVHQVSRLLWLLHPSNGHEMYVFPWQLACCCSHGRRHFQESSLSHWSASELTPPPGPADSTPAQRKKKYDKCAPHNTCEVKRGLCLFIGNISCCVRTRQTCFQCLRRVRPDVSWTLCLLSDLPADLSHPVNPETDLRGGINKNMRENCVLSCDFEGQETCIWNASVNKVYVADFCP